MKSGHIPVQRLLPVSTLWEPKERPSSPPRGSKSLPKLLEPNATLSPKATNMGPGCVSAVGGDKYAVSGAVAPVVDLATGVPLALRELPMLRKVRLEQGAGLATERPSAKGWDPRVSKNGLFGSFGANGGDPSPPLIGGSGAKFRPRERDEAAYLAKLEAAAAEEEARLRQEMATLEALEEDPAPWGGGEGEGEGEGGEREEKKTAAGGGEEMAANSKEEEEEGTSAAAAATATTTTE